MQHVERVAIEAREEARAATSALGRVLRELAGIAEKQDGCIDDVRKVRADMRLLLDAFRRLQAVESSKRNKLDSFADLDAAVLGNVTARELTWMRWKRRLRNWTLAGARRAVQGIAIVAVLAGAGVVMRACHITLPVPVEVSP